MYGLGKTRSDWLFRFLENMHRYLGRAQLTWLTQCRNALDGNDMIPPRHWSGGRPHQKLQDVGSTVFVGEVGNEIYPGY